MHPYFYPGLELGPATIERLVHAIPADRMDEPADPTRFSPREVIAHLADWEPILLGRMRTSRDNPGSILKGRDEGEMAVANDYRSLDPVQQAALYRSRRAETIEWLKSLSDEDWSKIGVHEERGPISVWDQANMLLGHDLYHLEQLARSLNPS